MAAVPVVQQLALSEATIVVDSAFRTNPRDSPGNFAAKLPGAIRDAKRGHHQSLSWAQGMYGHTPENMTIRIRFSTYVPPGPDPWLYCFLTPYYMYTSPDGTDEKVPFAAPVNGSYAADLEAALNYPMYFVAPGVMDVAPGSPAMSVVYSKSTGFIIQCLDPDFFEIEQGSSWLQLAHDTHGFGERISSRGFLKYESPTASGPTDTIRSATTPNLIPSRFVGIACPEMAQRRQLSSFSNVESEAFGSSEVNVFPITYKDNGAWKTKATPGDPTVINMNPTDGVGQLTMSMFDNRGYQVGAGNPWTYFATRFLTRTEAMQIAGTTRSNNLQNCIVQMWSGGQVIFTIPLGVGTMEMGMLCKSDDMMHKFLLQSMG